MSSAVDNLRGYRIEGKEDDKYIAAAAPDVVTYNAPIRTSAEAMPEFLDDALFTPGVKRTTKEKRIASQGISRLVIPTDVSGSNVAAGGYVSPRKAHGMV